MFFIVVLPFLVANKNRLLWMAGACFCLQIFAGCAGKMVKDRLLIEKTALALWLYGDTLSLSEKRVSGKRIDYLVTTKTGKVYDCYVTAGFSFSWKVVSDATCQSR